MSRAVLSLGSNLGDREGHLRSAVAALAPWLLAVSGAYETPPWGDAEQPEYLNAVAMAADRDAAARDWLERAQRIEQAAGRQRDPGRRFGPRTLDVDVICVWTDDGLPIESQDADLILPHPRAHLRAFVLRPWIDIEPHGRLPGHGWLTDLVRTVPVADDMLELRPRPDITLESDQ